MNGEKPSKLEKYGALMISLSCLASLVSTWGNNWILTGILALGVLVCGIIGFFDMRRAINRKG